MARFTLPRDLYHGKGALEALKTFTGKKAIVCVGGGSMKRFGFLDRFELYSQIKEGMDDIATGNTRLFSEAMSDIRSRRNR